MYYRIKCGPLPCGSIPRASVLGHEPIVNFCSELLQLLQFIFTQGLVIFARESMPYSSTDGQIARSKVFVVVVRAATPLLFFLILVLRGIIILVVAEKLRRSQCVCGQVLCGVSFVCGDQHVHKAISTCMR